MENNWWVYKCNSKNRDYQSMYGDWANLFASKTASKWGQSECLRGLDQLEKGDMVIAYQTDRNEIVGIAKVSQSSAKDGNLYLKPVEKIGVKVRPLKQTSRQVSNIAAFVRGPIKTIYKIELAEVRTLLTAAKAENIPDGILIAPTVDLKLPERTAVTITRVVRDSAKAQTLKQVYGHQCQICGLRISLGKYGFYSEVHHIRPLAIKHGGLDVESNMIVVCPTHHACLDFGVVKFLKRGKVEIDGQTFSLIVKHEIAKENLDYNNKIFASRK